MANFTSTHTGATIDASVTIISGSGVTQSDLIKLNAVTSTAVELNLLDGVTATTAELNILDGVTATATELNYLDGADSSITTLSLPDNTTITTFGASLIDDANAAAARTTLGVDAAGTDNSTNVTLVTTSHDYLSISGQAITLGSIDISDDTNLVGGDGLALTGDTLSVNVDDSSIEINSDTLRVKASGVTNAMLANSSVSYGGVSVALGASDATPSFDLSDATSLPIVAGTTGTLSVARGGTGATTASGARTNLNVDVAGTDNSTDVTLVTTSHDYLSLSGQAITLGTIDIGDDTNLVGGTGITLTGDTLSTTDSEIVHDNLSGFVSNEHIDHSGVSITAGAGLTGGGDITATRDIAVGAGTGVTVNADDIAIGQDVGTTQDVTFNSVTADIIGDIRGATKFQAKADVALNKGDAVYISGVSGTTPTVDIADANDSAKMPSFGLAASSVSINASVEIITFGTLAGLNTSAFSVGDIIFISTNGTSGNTLTATAPSGESSLIQNIGIVQRSHASAGSIKVGGAGRTNATPNLDDGDIFIGNGSNQAVTAALNTKIQDYLNTGVNLPSPTFTGDINFSDASTPTLTITDSTNTAQLRLTATDTTTDIGSLSAHKVNFRYNNDIRVQLEDDKFRVNAGADDMNFVVTDTSAVSLIHADAALSRIGIRDGSPSYTLDVNGTGRFTGAVQLDDNLTVTGDLQVNGTTTTVNQTNLDVSDNIIGLNRGASSNANDSGIIIERGSTGDNAAIIFDESADKFTVGTTTSTPSATGNITVTAGTMVANVEGNVTGNVTGDVTGDVTGNADTATALATGRTISLTGDVTGTSASFDGSGNVNLAATIAANSVALGTDTTGNYMSDLTEGTGIDITHTPAEGSNATITLDLTEVGFGGGANRLITDDGDGTVSTEANLTFNGTFLDFNDSRIRHNNATFGTYDWENYQQDDGTLIWAINGTGGAEVTLSADGSDYNTTFLQLGNKIRFATNGNSYINTSGNVGIGTASPGTKLEVAGVFRISETGDSSDYLEIGVGADATTGGTSVLTNNGSMVFGTTDSSSLIVRTNNTEAMRIDNSQNVGIGTASPDTLLHIDEDDAAVAFKVTGGSGGEKIASFIRDVGVADPYAEVYIHAGGGDPQITFRDVGNETFSIGVDDSANAFKISDNSAVGTNDRLTIDSSGNVGIGVTDPSTMLEVAGHTRISGVGSGLFFDTTGTEASNYIKTINDFETVISNGRGSAGFGVIGNQSIRFGFGNNFSNAETDLFINTSGNVGIGTDSPAAPLNVKSNSSSSSDSGITITQNGGSNAIFKMGEKSTDGGRFHMYDGGTEKIAFYTDGTDNHISAGNVGIGTTSPEGKVHIYQSDAGVAPHGDGDDLVLESNADTGISILSGEADGETGAIIFGSQNDSFGAGLQYNYYENRLKLFTGNDTHSLQFSSANNVLAMTIDTSQRVGIGTGSPGAKFTVLKDGTQASSVSTTYQIQTVSDSNGGIAIQAGDSSKAYLVFGDNGDYDAGRIAYTNSSHDMGFYTNNSERMTIDSSGNVGIGTQSPDTYNVQLASGYKIGVDNSSGGTTRIAEIEFYNTSDGSLRLKTDNASTGGIEFHTEGSKRLEVTRGGDVSITASSKLYFDSGVHTYIAEDTGDRLRFFCGGAEFMRFTEDTSDTLGLYTNNTLRISVNNDGDFIPAGDGTQDLGASSKRWGIIYSADLDLSNEGSQNDVDGTWGSYVIQEGEEDLFLINRRNGKKYKFMLQEVQD